MSSVAWPSGPRSWFKAPVSSEAWVRIPPLPGLRFVALCSEIRITQFGQLMFFLKGHMETVCLLSELIMWR